MKINVQLLLELKCAIVQCEIESVSNNSNIRTSSYI